MNDVSLTTAEMWELSRVGGCLLIAAQEMPDEFPGRDKIIEAGNRLFDVMNSVSERDDWVSRSPLGEESPDFRNPKLQNSFVNS